ncbi:hypothetical protein DFQ27_006950, partial [Actinomortierella ambigua]
MRSFVLACVFLAVSVVSSPIASPATPEDALAASIVVPRDGVECINHCKKAYEVGRRHCQRERVPARVSRCDQDTRRRYNSCYYGCG